MLVSSLFFLWGIANNLNGILIPHLRKALQLTNMQSTFVDTAVYLAYFSAAIPAGMILKKFGYKKGIITGLIVFSIGAFMFIPAANLRAYNIFLLGLFIIGCGLTILETAANPYASKLGDPATSTARLTLAQSFNGLAVFIAPVIGTVFILSGKEFNPDELAAMSEVDKLAYLNSEAASVKMPYLSLGIFLLAIAVLFLVNKFPELKEDEGGKEEGSLSGALKQLCRRAGLCDQLFYSSCYCRRRSRRKNRWLLLEYVWNPVHDWKICRICNDEMDSTQQIVIALCHHVYFTECNGHQNRWAIRCDCTWRTRIFYVDHVPYHFFIGNSRTQIQHKTRILTACNVHHRRCHFPCHHGQYH
ncbi:MAG: MFS transporter [Chitinophagaceae bacterium]|nr:MFS transporter [Chitinophagaceae bacterium]